jgi:hypothetical protein
VDAKAAEAGKKRQSERSSFVMSVVRCGEVARSLRE